MSLLRALLKASLQAIAGRWLVLTLLVLAATTYLSLSPLDRLPDAPGGDKLHHLLAYALLAFPAALAKPVGLRWWLLLFLVWGGGIEVLQPYVNRYGEVLDALANGLGVGLGAGLGLMAGRSILRPAAG